MGSVAAALFIGLCICYGHGTVERILTQTKNLSDQTAKLIDEAVRDLIQAGEAAAKKILAKQRANLHAVAKALLEFETLSGEEVKKIMAGGTINREDDEAKKKAGKKPASSVPRAGGARRGSSSGDMEPQPQS